MDETSRDRVGICCMMAKECLLLQSIQHFMNLKQSMEWIWGMPKDSARLFSHYIAQSQQEEFQEKFTSSHFSSFLMDSSTDKGNIEDE